MFPRQGKPTGTWNRIFKKSLKSTALLLGPEECALPRGAWRPWNAPQPRALPHPSSLCSATGSPAPASALRAEPWVDQPFQLVLRWHFPPQAAHRRLQIRFGGGSLFQFAKRRRAVHRGFISRGFLIVNEHQLLTLEIQEVKVQVLGFS